MDIRSSYLGLVIVSLFCLVLMGASPEKKDENKATPLKQSVPSPAKLKASKNEYAEIDISLTNESMKKLTQGTAKEKAEIMAAIKKSPGNYTPPVLYEFSNALFEEGKEKEGAFWFHAGQLRGRFDANRCADISARKAIVMLDKRYNERMEQYMIANLEKVEALVKKVVKWDRKTPRQYDHRWINLRSMKAVQASLSGKKGKTFDPLSLPEEEWKAIEKKTRKDYIEEIRNLVLKMKKS